MKFQERLQFLMKLKGIDNVLEFAKLHDIAPTTMDGIMKRQQRSNGPRIDTLQKICKGLGITVGEFLEESPTEEEKVFQRLNLDDDSILYIAAHLREPGFIEAVDLMQKMPIKARLVLQKACLLQNEVSE